MLRTLTVFLFSIFLSIHVSTANAVQSGKYKVINTDGFVQHEGKRTKLETERKSGLATVEVAPDDSLLLQINGSTIRLFPIENGLAAVKWNSQGSTLLHDTDILALIEVDDPSNVAAWGADLAWPDTIRTQLVLFTLSSDALAGFLVSETKGKTIVRQMEFRQVFGPSNRPHTSTHSNVASKTR
ncbi:hypothetical protein ABLO27_06890 [Roseibium sp. SCPC15]|uniref:hypothetical protein n=1 Tax=Roseibium sp. SCP15 TaxID=3141376 RepID=UPI0033379EDE